MACCIAMVLMLRKVLFMLVIGMLKVFSRILMDGMCVDALAPAVITMRGATFHPMAAILLRSGWYLLVFFCRGFNKESIITVCKFNELNCKVWV